MNGEINELLSIGGICDTLVMNVVTPNKKENAYT